MSESTVIRQAWATDLPSLATIGALAFDRDPMIRWAFPDGSTSDLAYVFECIFEPYVAAQSLLCTDDGSAVAAWLRPDQSPLLADYESETLAAIARRFPTAAARYRVLWDWTGQHIEESPGWFLDVLAVHPQFHGRGFGGALLSHGLALAANDGLPASLDTGIEANVAFYRARGFSVTAEADAPDGGPHVWFMSAHADPSN